MSPKKGPEAPPPDVRVGQIWRDCDTRIRDDRRLKVVAVYPEGSEKDARPHALVEDVDSLRKTRVALRRMRPGSTGYALEKDA